MAPEQVEKPQTVDHRADIYSLGVVFYEMLTGELPLGKFQPPSSCARGVQIDVRLDEVVLHALEKSPERRYQQASQVKTAVETIAAGAPKLEARRQGQDALAPAATDAGRFSRTAVAGAAWIGLFFLNLVVNYTPPGWALRHLFRNSPLGPACDLLVFMPLMLLGFAAMAGGTAMGGIALRQIRQARVAIRGWGLALFDILFFPLLLVNWWATWLAYLVGSQMGSAGSAGSERSPVPRPVILALVLIGLALNGLLIRAAARMAKQFVHSPAPPAHPPVTGAWSQVFKSAALRLVVVVIAQLAVFETLEQVSGHWKESSQELWGIALAVATLGGLAWACWPGYRLKGSWLFWAGGVVVSSLLLLGLDNFYSWHLRPNLGLYRESDWVAQHPGFQKQLRERVEKNRWRKPAAPGAETEAAPPFGPVIERVINLADTRTNFLINFKTGNLRTPPPETPGSNSANYIYDWARREGEDAAAGIIRGWVLSGFDMAAVTAPAQCWEELSPVQAGRRLELESSESFKIMSYGNISALPETCVFRTREGGIGILQITEHVSDPPGLKVRYKLLDQLPAALPPEPGVTAAEWSPVLLPGEKPDLQKILDEAKNLTSTGHFEEALQRYVWHHNHAQEYGDNWQNAVRLTSALSDWEELGRRYPKAKQALMEIRDKQTREFAEGRGYSELFQEVQAINDELQDDGATLALFKTIYPQDKQLAGQCYGYAENLLMQNGDYDWCLKCIGDPQAHFESCRRNLESQRESQQRMEAMRKQQPMPVPRSPGGAFKLPDMGQRATNNFVGQIRTLVEILVATGHQAAAEKIQAQAVSVLDDPRLKSAVSDAAEKIKKQSIPAGNK